MKIIPGFEGKYQVAEDCKVFSLYYNKYLKPELDKHGYHRYTLYFKGKAKHYLAHRLFAQAYIPNPENKTQINHKDGNKLNNTIENLEWASPSENLNHAIAAGLKVSPTGEKHHRSFLKGTEVLQIRRLCEQSVYNGAQIGSFFSVDHKLVSLIKLRKRWKHI